MTGVFVVKGGPLPQDVFESIGHSNDCVKVGGFVVISTLTEVSFHLFVAKI